MQQAQVRENLDLNHLYPNNQDLRIGVGVGVGGTAERLHYRETSGIVCGRRECG